MLHYKWHEVSGQPSRTSRSVVVKGGEGESPYIFYKINNKIAIVHLKKSYLAVRNCLFHERWYYQYWYKTVSRSWVRASWYKQSLPDSTLKTGYPNLELLCSFGNITLETVVRIRNPYRPPRSVLIVLLISLANALDTILLDCIRLCSGFVFAWGVCK